MLLYLAKKIFTAIVKVHNQFVSSLHQKECKKSSHQSHFSISVSSVTQSCLTLCNSINCSTPGFPVHHQFPELAQTHVHRVGDAIQPSHPLPSPSPGPSIVPRVRVFCNESALRIRWPKYWSFRFSISPSREHPGWSSLGWTGLISLQS